jgi:hypothetical protein
LKIGWKHRISRSYCSDPPRFSQMHYC